MAERPISKGDAGAKDLVVLITMREPNEETGVMETLVSHGVHLASGRTVILPSEDPRALGARFDPGLGEFVLSREQLEVVDRREQDKPSRGVDEREAERRAFIETQMATARDALIAGDDPRQAVINATTPKFGAEGAARLADAIARRVRAERRQAVEVRAPGRDDGLSP